MKAKKTLISVVSAAALLTFVTATSSVADPNSNATESADRVSQSKQVTPKYTDEDIVAFFGFGTGPIAKKHPELLKRIGRKKQNHVSNAAIQTVTADLKHVDPQFHAKVTLGLQANSAYKTKAAIARLNKDTHKVLDHAKTGKTAADSVGDGGLRVENYYWVQNFAAQSYFAVTTVAVSAEAVATALAVFLYVEPSNQTAFDRQSEAVVVANTL